jgi:exo-beta-1,3-glucanase (GH17 family)
VTNTVHTNIQPYYNGGSSADAGSFLVSQAGIVQSACSGQSVVVSEAGWPSAGGSNGEADATPEDQEAAISAIWEATNGQVTFFSYGNDLWKTPGTEQNFGMSLLFVFGANWGVGLAQLF